MANEQWERLRELFHQALDLPPAEQSAFLDRAYTDDTMRAELDSLLRYANTELLAVPAADGLHGVLEAAIPDVNRDETPAGHPETMIGPYHLVEKIAQGGMGEVWRAEQMHPIRREVALKLIKPVVLIEAGTSTHEVITRFESERQTLALMNHPAIAKVFDAGSTDRANPTS
jgi:serine/threonine protein kinase